ncbi:hypothetical protein BGX34_001938 [Mortierella sp. NVP85]|nr:hypothetical protein BGX34_001938 [Mortierella sp. NVP85]
MDTDSNTTATTSAEPSVTLLLKVHVDEGSRLSFGLKGHLLEPATALPPPYNADAQDHPDDTKEKEDKDSTVEAEQPQQNESLASQGPPSTTAQQLDVTLAATAHESIETKANNNSSTNLGFHPVQPMLSRESSLGPDSHIGPWSSGTSLVTCGTDTSSHSANLFFVEVNSEAELQDICQGSDFEREVKERNIVAVDAQQGPQEEGVEKFTWTWEFPSRDHVQDDHLSRKAVFAFLYRNPSSGDIEIISQFSLWIVGSSSTDQNVGLRRPTQRLAPSAKGHWRRASTPERFGSTFGRPPSYPNKGASNLSTYTSPRSADAAPGSGLTTDTSAPNSGSSMNLNDTLVDAEDGPLFRATVVECESHIREMKAATKRIMKAAQTVIEARKALIEADEAFVKELEGFKPAEPLVNRYLRPMSQSLAHSSDDLSLQMHNLLIEPLRRFYTNDIKTAEAKRKTFDDESKEYYGYLSRYMAIKHESSRKKSEADAKYERKRKQFEKERFEYWGFLLDMRVGGSKSDEILHHLTNYSEKHCKNMMDLSLLAEDLRPSLDEMNADLMESHRKAAAIRRGRQERRKERDAQDEILLAGMTKGSAGLAAASSPPSNSTDGPPEANLDIINTPQPGADDHHDNAIAADQKPTSGSSPTSHSSIGVSQPNNSVPKFTGIRDLEHQDIDASSALGRRKEGFLFATSRPSLHNNTVVLEKPSLNWHKYWCVVSDGYLHEYSHWKKGVTMLHNEPINLKISAVRPCRNQDRRFCFEVITPKYRRVYQATSAEDMNSWVSVISNAIQSLLDGTTNCQNMEAYSSSKDSKHGGLPGDGPIGNGRSSMDLQPGDRNGSTDMLGIHESDTEHLGTRLLKIMRETHPANNFCAECGAKNPDWCAINLGILICIECSGIHRSLGTHISKVRSFTLDTTSYTRDLFDFIRAVGNDVSNRIWEATLGSEHTDKVAFRKPLVNDTREYKVSFIQKKYVERAFVNRQKFSEGDDSREELAILATKALFQAANTNSIPDVIEAFAAGADLNAVQETEADNEGSEVSGDMDSQPEQSSSHHQEMLTPIAEHCSSFMVMQTSPLLLALHHGVPFSLDDQYEVYPLAEFMTQNGATSNLSVEVRLIEEEAESPGQAAVEGPSLAQQSAHLLSADGDMNWDSSQVDPEDIRNHHMRNNRRSLGEVVHMRGEGGAGAMEYLRAKSAARGEPMAISPASNGYGDHQSFSCSPPSMANSPRYASPPSSGPYSSTVVRQSSTSSHHDISTLFQKRRESEGALGPFTSSKSAEGEKKSHKMQVAGLLPSSPSALHTPFIISAHGVGHGARKVKATLTKSLRLSAAYIKNNMLKEEKEYSVPIITQTIFSTSPPPSKQPDTTFPPHQAPTDGPLTNPDTSLSDSSLSGEYIILHRKGSIAAPGPAPSASATP